MPFARCLAAEPDAFFMSATACGMGVSHRAAHKSGSESTTQRSKVTTFLGWPRKKSTKATEEQKCDDNQREHDAPVPNHRSPTASKPSTPPSKSPVAHNNARRHQQQPPINSDVVIRRGEKSFLEFHQNYSITRHLGEGSYSTVKQVTHRKKGGFFACKIVDKASLSPVDRVALSHEVRVLSTVRHDHIMRLYEVIEDDSKCYLIMELAENGDLFDKIVKQGRFPEAEAQKVASALVEALHYCHSNAIIHRDVKPENVLLSADHSIKLCDFGFAKQLRDIHEQSVDSCGTPGYAAPEILDGKPYGVEVDVFSLGVVTYIMLCGYPPFPMKLAQLRSHRFNVRFPAKDWASVDTAVKELLTRMLHVKPELRPKMAELRAHPWIQQGKALLDELRAEAEERRRLEALQRKQLLADTIRKQLITSGFEVVKHGRQGLPHRTKLRLSTDGKVLSWQPKLLKRGLLKYQNAKSITSIFGFGGNGSSQNCHVNEKKKTSGGGSNGRLSLGKPSIFTHPQISRLSSLEDDSPALAGRRSEPVLSDESENSAIVRSTLTPSESISGHGSTGTLSSVGSASSNGSASWIDKKNWWRTFRRPNDPRHQRAERSASGGFSFAAFSLARASSTDTQSTSTPSSAEASAEEYTSGTSRLSLSGSSSMGSDLPPSLNASPLASPTNRVLDSSIHLRDIRLVTIGEQSAFFGCEEDDNNAVSEATEGNSKKKTRPARTNSSSSAASNVAPANALTVTTRFRELHLEFTSSELREAFAFLLEQATLPLEDVASAQPSYLYRSPATTSKATTNVISESMANSPSPERDENQITAEESANEKSAENRATISSEAPTRRRGER